MTDERRYQLEADLVIHGPVGAEAELMEEVQRLRAALVAADAEVRRLRWWAAKITQFAAAHVETPNADSKG